MAIPIIVFKSGTFINTKYAYSTVQEFSKDWRGKRVMLVNPLANMNIFVDDVTDQEIEEFCGPVCLTCYNCRYIEMIVPH